MDVRLADQCRCLVAGFVDLIYLFFTNLNHQKVSQKIMISSCFPLLVDYLVEKVDCLVVVLVERVVIELVAEFVQIVTEQVVGLNSDLFGFLPFLFCSRK